MMTVTGELASKVKSRISTLIASDSEFAEFINSILKYQPLIYGGFVRDALLETKSKGDFDVVLLKGPKTDIDYLYTLNKFGGKRFKVGSVEIDLWNLEDTKWITELELVPTIGNLFEGTNSEWNKVAYNLNENKLIIGSEVYDYHI